MSLTIVRALYGDGTGWARHKKHRSGPRLRAFAVKVLDRGIEESFENDPSYFFRDKVQYVTMGEWATAKLKSYGAKNITQVDKQPYCQPKRFFHFWNRLYLSRKAMELFGDILYPDFDCTPTDKFEECFDEAMESMEGKRIQIPLTRYQRGSTSFKWREQKGEGWDEVSPKIGLCGGFTLFRDITFLDEVFEDWNTYKGFRYGTEAAIMHTLEKRYGITTVKDFYDNLEPEACLVLRSPLNTLGITKDKAIFQHR